MSERPRSEQGYEKADVTGRQVFVLTILALATILVTLALVAVAQAIVLRQQATPAAEGYDQAEPATAAERPRPGTLTSRRPLLRHREEMNERLESSAWVDRSAGIARIPVEQAAELLVSDPDLLRRSFGPEATVGRVDSEVDGEPPSGGGQPAGRGEEVRP